MDYAMLPLAEMFWGRNGNRANASGYAGLRRLAARLAAPSYTPTSSYLARKHARMQRKSWPARAGTMNLQTFTLTSQVLPLHDILVKI